MARKQQQPKKQYIAIYTHRDEVIAMGEMEYIQSELMDYIDYNDLAEDDIENDVEIYELGDKKDITIHPRYDITISE